MRKTAAALAFIIGSGACDAAALLCTPILGCTCTVTASDIEFGAFAPNTGTQDATGQIAVDCTGVIDVAPSVQTRLGTGQWGTFAARKMRSGGGDLLDYNIYTTSQHNVVWGDGSGGSAVVNVSGGLLSLGRWTATRTMFARAAPAPATKPGAYADTVVVRIVW
jgi:spore coat protein U-like protein